MVDTHPLLLRFATSVILANNIEEGGAELADDIDYILLP